MMACPRVPWLGSTATYLAAAMLLSSAATVAAQAELLPESVRRKGTGLDAQVEGGGGFALQGAEPDPWLVRGRLGLLLVREPWVLGFGATAETGGLAGLGFGVQLDLIQIWDGWSVELGSTMDLDGRLVGHATLGYALFGIELQHRFRPRARDDEALFFKLRIPIGVALFFLG